jgi:GNAT superfamily N-acetyltransferase
VFQVRSARAADISHISPWTRDTFDWGDYVGESLGEWLTNPDLQVLVAVDSDDIPRAVSVVQMLSGREGWLSAARVHPEARRQGLGTLLNDASVDWIGNQGGVVARLAVENTNTAATSQVMKLGYRPTSTWLFGKQSEAPRTVVDNTDKPTIVGRSDVDPAWMYWSTSEIADAGRMLLPSGWKWRRATVGDVDLAAREQRLLSNAAGWLILEVVDKTSIEIVWVAASQSDFPRLVDAALRYALEHGLTDVSFRIPETGWTGEALRREGIDTKELTIYAKPTIH